MKYYYLYVLMALTMICACSKDNSITLKEVDDVCTMMDDLVFMHYCYNKFDVNKDGKVSMSEAAAVKSIYIDGMVMAEHSFKGIEYFINLETLYCEMTTLSGLDLRNNTKLMYLNCSDCDLTSLDLSRNTALSTLYCTENDFTSLDVSKNLSLELLDCQRNPNLKELWLKKGQEIKSLKYNSEITTIKYK